MLAKPGAHMAGYVRSEAATLGTPYLRHLEAIRRGQSDYGAVTAIGT